MENIASCSATSMIRSVSGTAPAASRRRASRWYRLIMEPKAA